jgi:hypothetical protein
LPRLRAVTFSYVKAFDSNFGVQARRLGSPSKLFVIPDVNYFVLLVVSADFLFFNEI